MGSIDNCTFSDNNFEDVIHLDKVGGTFIITNSIFINNTVSHGVLEIIGASIELVNNSFADNIGSFYAFGCNITFSGCIRFKNCTEPLNKREFGVAVMFQMGGAITCFQSSMQFTGSTYLLNNT